jgi:iron complex outermembrane receptor protein
MKTNFLFKTAMLLTAMLFLNSSFAQSTLSGTVVDDSNQPLPGVNIIIQGTAIGTTTDFDGNFSLTTSEEIPLKVEASYIGFATQIIDVNSADASINVSLAYGAGALDEIVVSASRFAQRVFESPITIEKYSAQQIKATPAADFFNGLENVKGIQLQQGGLLLNQVVTRGFATVYNEGFVTLVDNMNNMSPLFGFAMGNLIGLNELDVQSVEIIPGPASALYGADAYKGIMFLNSKNPFEHEGISAYYRTGVTEQKVAGQNMFNDIGVRLATKLGEKWAVKASVSHKKGTEWMPGDYSHQPTVGKELDPAYPKDSPDYDALNVYGENSYSSADTWNLVKQLMQATDPRGPAAGGATADFLIGRAPEYFDKVLSSGYKDSDLISNNAENTKGTFAIHFRPDEKTEISLTSLIGRGDSPLQGFGRYAMKGIQIQQHKLQIDRGRLNFRTYYTREEDGDSYQLSAAATLIGNSPTANIVDFATLGVPGIDPVSGLEGWFTQYQLGYMGALAAAKGLPAGIAGIGGLIGQIGADIFPGGGTSINGLFSAQGGTGFAHPYGRANAKAGELMPGTAAFQAAFDSVTSENLPVFNRGAGIFDDTKTYNYELNYDLSDLTGDIDILVGGSMRKTELNSKGTIYSDQDGPIEYTEFGAYAQGVKKVLNDRIDITASIRVDKHEFFDANFTPRIGALIPIDKNQNLRMSYQTGFRNPTNQDQYIGLFAGATALLGASADNFRRYNGTVILDNGNFNTFTGDYILKNAFTEGGGAANLQYIKAEKISSYDLGYRFKSKGLTIDISGYITNFTDKIGSRDVYVPALTDLSGNTATMENYRQLGSYMIYSVDSNSKEKLRTYGLSGEVIKTLSSNFVFNVIYDYNKLDYTPRTSEDFEAGYNTPEHNIKAGLLGNFDKLSFNIASRYTSEYYYEASFVDGMIPSRNVIDAQVSYDLPSINAVIKVGGNNIGGDEYFSVLGGGQIGSIYYTAINFNF